MPVTAEDLVKRILNTGLVSESELEELKRELAAEGRDEESRFLADELVSRGKLTSFQADVLHAERAVPLVLGEYVVLDELGRGGMGVVLKARHRRMDRLAAVKILADSVSSCDDSLQRFQREVKAAARLEHPNIVRAYDAGETPDGVHYLVMQYVNGIDLSLHIKQQGPLPVGMAVDYIVQTARGLQYALEEQLIIHRDIKPANLLLDVRGRVRILDMGLARLSPLGELNEEGETQLGLTGTGAILGTAPYMAPEHAMDTKRADHRADIYSLGCSLYYLLVGASLYCGDTALQQFVAHREHEIPSLRQVRTETPEGVDAIFRKMVAKYPDDRPQSYAEVIEALEPFVGVKTGMDQIYLTVGDETEQTDSSTEESAVSNTADTLVSRASREKILEAERSLCSYIDACGHDGLISEEEEQSIFHKGSDLGLALAEIEAFLNRQCRQHGWPRQSTLVKQLTVMMAEAAKNDGVVEHKEFEYIVNFAVRRNMPRKTAEELCVTLVLDNNLRVKQKPWDRWFARKRRQYGLG